MNCPECGGSNAYPVQPVELPDGRDGVEIACSKCGTFRRPKASLEP